MLPIQPIRALRPGILVAGMAILGLALGACTSANPSASAPASAGSSTGAAPSGSQAPAVSQAPLVGSFGANESQTIHVFEPGKNVTLVPVGTLTGCTSTAGCQGDYVLGDDPLLDATTRHEVGRLLFECFRVDVGSTLFHCPGNTIILAGRGQIVYTEDVHFVSGYGPPDVWPITGGTGEFLGATGFVTSPADSTYTEGGDFVITVFR